MTDGREAANVSLDNVTADAVVGGLGEGFALMNPVLDQAMLAVAADALGAMESLNTQTLEYLKTRKQFGTHIGSFQALQHRMVDMFAACENTKSLLYRAVCALDAGNEDAQRSLLALKVMVGRAGRKIGGEGIQMHGGMGMTEELSVGSYVKRLMIANTLFGDADYQQQRFSALVNAEEQEPAAVAAA
ncbi:Acyl-CoA dehydrogenase, C-terminal domain, putative [marine gamma proteobacterium HTCC2148]|nr:Acyl-CoA dehydrogenase, C-terminal domain, putative [marine gamma proteobacterium HTCC2148]